MKAILDLSGWEKQITMNEYQMKRGIIEINLYPPMSFLVSEASSVSEETYATVIFRHYGKYKDGLPVFKYEL